MFCFAYALHGVPMTPREGLPSLVNISEGLGVARGREQKVQHCATLNDIPCVGVIQLTGCAVLAKSGIHTHTTNLLAALSPGSATSPVGLQAGMNIM